MLKHPNREAWLVAAVAELRPLLNAAGAPAFPDPLVSMGLPSKSALSSKRRRIGECWTEKTSASEKRCTVFISPTLSDAVQVLDVLLHELIHAAVGVKAGHKGPFRKVAEAVGLAGPMRATTAGPVLKAKLETLAETLGDFPHDALRHFRDPNKKQKCRQRKYTCEHCGAIIRAGTDSLTAQHLCEDGRKGLFILQDLPDEGE